MSDKYVNLIILMVLIIVFIILLACFIRKKRKPLKYAYRSKKCLMTNTEFKYFEAFKRILQNTRYVILPQVCLSTIVERKEVHKFQSELSRIADFCIFNEDYKPLLVIEINDSSHNLRERKNRDSKVKYILKSAKIPLLTIWTKDEFNTSKFAQLFKENGIKINSRGNF